MRGAMYGGLDIAEALRLGTLERAPVGQPRPFIQERASQAWRRAKLDGRAMTGTTPSGLADQLAAQRRVVRELLPALRRQAGSPTELTATLDDLEMGRPGVRIYFDDLTYTSGSEGKSR